MGKSFLHKCICMKMKPYFLFLKEMLFITRLSIIGIAYIQLKNARKLVGIIRQLDLFEEE